MALHDIVQPHIADFEHDNKSLSVTCRIAFDGIEYVGRLWFAERRDPWTIQKGFRYLGIEL